MKSPQTILTDYLAMRRSLGFKLQKHEPVLREFLRFFATQKASYLTAELALQWARKPQHTDPAWWTTRLSILRGFATYWKTVDARTEIPYRHVLIREYKRPTPFIYTDQQIIQILDSTRQLSSKDNLTYWALFGLLRVTGMRVGEALALNNADVDLNEGTITVQNAKLNTSRLLSLHSTTQAALKQYVTKRNRQFTCRRDTPFFVTRNAGRPLYTTVRQTYRRVLFDLGIRKPGQHKGPRIHDLRHTFAVRSLVSFYEQGQDIDARIHALSTYLGHTSLSRTYWYLTAIPELMGLALSRLEEKIGGAV